MASLVLQGITSPTDTANPVTTVHVTREWPEDVSAANALWTWLPWVQPLTANDGVSGTPESATFEWLYGSVQQPGALSASVWDFLNIGQCYISIWVHDAYGSAPCWIGKVCQESVRPFAETAYPAGEQQFQAHGLKQLLYDKHVLGSVVINDTDVVHIDRPIRFNPDGQPNRSPELTAFGAYCIYTAGQGDDAAELWSAWQIADHVLAFFANGELDGGWAGPQFYLSGYLDTLADLTVSRLYQGESVGEAIDDLIGPSRGLGWYTFTVGYGPVYLEVFPYYDVGWSPAAVIDAGDPRIDPQITFDDSRTYDTITVMGGPVTMCCTFATDTEGYAPLYPAWPVALETEYLALTGDDDTGADTKRQAQKYKPVFSHFVVPLGDSYGVYEWDGTIDGFNCLPDMVDGALDFTIQKPLYKGTRRFLRMLPYDEEPADGSIPSQRRAFALVGIADDEDVLHYYPCNKMVASGQSNCGVHFGDHDMSVEIEPDIPHMAALDIFTADDTAKEPGWSYLTYLVTAAFELDVRLAVTVARAGFESPITSTPRRKIIQDRDAELVIVAPNTIWDVDPEDTTTFVTSGATMYAYRDDTARVIDKAMIAAQMAWQQVATLTMPMQGITLQFTPGMIIQGLLDAAGYTPVGTTLSERSWDFMAGTTTVRSGIVEIA